MNKEKQINYLIGLLIFINIYPIFVLANYIPMPGAMVQYGYYSLLALVILLLGLPGKLEPSLLFVVFSAVLSLLANDVDEKYNTPVRFTIFLLLVLAIGPLFYNANLVRFRKLLYEKLTLVFMWIGGVSFFCTMGLPSFGVGHFSGLLAHSMLLGPVASLGGLYAFSKFITAEKRKRTVYLSLFGLNTLCVLLASSRVAVLAYVFGFFVFLVLSRFPGRNTYFVVIGLLGLFLAVGSGNQSLFELETETVFSRDMEQNTRELLWDDRIAEFNLSPMFGIGFEVQKDDINSQEGTGDESGVIEPGSTYLMILSMTGAIGGLAFSVFFLKPFFSRQFWQQVIFGQPEKAAALGFFMVHFIAEGYIYSAGSLLAFTFWLLMGAIYPYKGLNSG